jgi:hypothetical protein
VEVQPAAVHITLMAKQYFPKLLAQTILMDVGMLNKP